MFTDSGAKSSSAMAQMDYPAGAGDASNLDPHVKLANGPTKGKKKSTKGKPAYAGDVDADSSDAPSTADDGVRPTYQPSTTSGGGAEPTESPFLDAAKFADQPTSSEAPSAVPFTTFNKHAEGPKHRSKGKSATFNKLAPGLNGADDVASSAAGNSYSGAGGLASGGSVTGTNGLVNIFSSLFLVFYLFFLLTNNDLPDNAGKGGSAVSGAAGGFAQTTSGAAKKVGDSYSGAGGQAPGGSVTNAGGLVNIFSSAVSFSLLACCYLTVNHVFQTTQEMLARPTAAQVECCLEGVTRLDRIA